MEALNREVEAIEVPALPQYEPDEVLFTDRKLSNVELLEAYRHTIHCLELMWQHHFEFLLLGYGAYLTFAEFCREALPDIPDQHISQMVAGVDVDLFRADEELRRLARLAIETDVAGAFQEDRSPDEINAELAESDAGKKWLEELEAIKDPWFNMGTGDGLYHYYGSWNDDPRIPYQSLTGHIAALQAGEQIDRPTEEVVAERDRIAADARSATAQARFTGLLVVAMPTGAALFAELIQPGFVGGLLSNAASAALLAAAAALQLGGFAAIRRLSRVEDA
jgi:pyruvate,water dikinase